jgi:hypothetical protein
MFETFDNKNSLFLSQEGGCCRILWYSTSKIIEYTVVNASRAEQETYIVHIPVGDEGNNDGDQTFYEELGKKTRKARQYSTLV